MSYLSLYRKWRPQSFDEVISQGHVTRTLQNALSMKRIAHAYLFCGPRGTGKTTVAKLFAKALNCKQGPTAEPCNECANCRQIREGNAMDVIEIDGASNRGIDEIRDLREKVKFAPSEGQYKVYIIDEVHMLTTEAFNALLKTLEEPPGHVIFILATTEPHKIPATILSRCQRFDFKRISMPDLAAHLRHIADEEGVQIADETLRVIARNAEGGLRDALSILDQCISFSGDKIALEEVRALLGTVDIEVLARLTDSAVKGALAEGLSIIEELVNAGKDLRQLVRDWTGHLRNLLLVKAAPGQELTGVAPEDLAVLQGQAQLFTLPVLLSAVELLAQVEGEMRWAPQSKLPLELALIKLTRLVTSPAESVAVPTASTVLPASSASAASPAPSPTAPPSPAPVAAAAPAGKTKRASGTVEGSQAPNSVPVTVPPGETEPAPPQVTETKPLEPGAAGFEQLLARWPGFLEMLRQEKLTPEQAFLREGRVASFADGALSVEFSPSHRFHMDRLSNPAHKGGVEKALRKYFGVAIRLECVIAGAAPPPKSANTVDAKSAAKTVAAGMNEVSATSQDDPKAARADEPVDAMVKRAVDLFGAKVVKVE